MSDMTGTESPSETGQRPGWLVRVRDWVDARLPIMDAWKKHLSEYYAPKNFNFWYYFGVLSMLVLVMQLLTGIWLTMNYTPSAEAAFASVEYIMRDVDLAGCCAICIQRAPQHSFSWCICTCSEGSCTARIRNPGN